MNDLNDVGLNEPPGAPTPTRGSNEPGGSPAAPCSPFPLLIAQFEQVLKETGLVDAAAIEDPHGFDNFATQAAIYQAWAQLHRIIVANDRVKGGGSE